MGIFCGLDLTRGCYFLPLYFFSKVGGKMESGRSHRIPPKGGFPSGRCRGSFGGNSGGSGSRAFSLRFFSFLKADCFLGVLRPFCLLCGAFR